MTGLLDKLPPAVRHAVFSAASLVVLALLNWAQTSYTTWSLPAPVIGFVAVFLPVLVSWVTPLTQQYGLTGDPLHSVPAQDVVSGDESA